MSTRLLMLPRGSAAIFSMMVICSPAWAGICRVTTSGSVFNDGSSWVVPTDLQQALAAPGICTEIWVAKGLYKPTKTASTTISFHVTNGIGVYGGFAGSETNRDQRDFYANLTVLSGDIDNNDNVDADGLDYYDVDIVGNNSEHVVFMSLVASGTVLDGLIITGGDSRSALGVGGGLYCFSSGGGCNPSLSHLTFIGNAAHEGGAIYNDGSGANSSPSISNVTFFGNRATLNGGAIANKADSSGFSSMSSPSISDTIFAANSADVYGGAIYNYAANDGFSNPTLTRVSLDGNSAYYGGAIAGSALNSGTVNPILENVTISGNHAVTGGGFFTYAASGSSTPQLNSVTFSENQADTRGGAISSSGAASQLSLRNAILWGDRAPLGFGPEVDNANGATTTIDHSIVKGSGGSAAWNPAFGTDGGFNLDADPRLGVLAFNVGNTQTMLPGTGSPAIDAGNDATCPDTDQRNVTRPQGAHCDIGAAEVFPIDLIGHKGLEACWSKALTKPAFLDLVRAQIEGAVTCVSPTITANYAACNTAACPGGATGCPLTTHASAFTGIFANGDFTAPGTVDNTVIPVQLTSPFAYSCQYSASNVSLDYTPSYVFTDDGNLGDYAALLNRFAIVPTNYSISSADVTCQSLAGTIGPAIVSGAQAALQSSLGQKVREATLGQAVCPLLP